MTVRIGAYRQGYEEALASIHNASFPGKRQSGRQLAERLAKLIRARGRVWIAFEAGRPVGYGWTVPVPGLSDVVELQCCVAPGERSRGLGSRLLQHLLDDLDPDQVRSVSHPVESLDHPAARFLLRRGFEPEHEEWEMERATLTDLPEETLPAGYHLQSFDQPAAIRLFRTLYEASFSGLPWYQPYGSAAEVAAELPDPAGLLFLLHEQKPAGFLWLRRPDPVTGVIEPFGLVPSYRRRGLSRPFLLAALHRLAGAGAVRVSLGVWRQNQAAVHLYESVGFRRIGTRVFLARDLQSEP